MVLGGDGAEVDWFVGYDPPAEKFQTRLETVLKGDGTYKVVQAAYAKNPKDAATVFKLARKWSERYDEAKAADLYKQVIVLDPQGTSGMYTQEYTGIAVPYREFAEYSVATATPIGAKPDMAPIKAFIAKYPKSKLIKQAYQEMSYYYGYQASKEEAEKFFPDYVGRFPDDPSVLRSWLMRIVRDKGPIDKGLELAEKLKGLTDFHPDPSTNQIIAQVYDLKGDKAKVEDVFGKGFIEGQVQGLAYNLVAYSNYWLNKNENQDSAVEMAETALKLQPENAYFLQQAANAYAKTGHDAKALELYGPGWMKKNIADANALYSYASFWTRQEKNLPSALAAAKKVVELKPKTYYYWAALSDVQAKMKNTAEAIKAAEKAVEVAEGNAKPAMQKKLDALKNPTPEKK
jgi:tetratricopeptide (TPR) repeat protein